VRPKGLAAQAFARDISFTLSAIDYGEKRTPPLMMALIPHDFLLDSSLRANGSRQCAPDDRLREAIHWAAKAKLDCFVAFAPRNDEIRV
jgi:hypothetical protein